MGPLEGIRIIELAGLGPAPHAGMLLADLGADVIRVDRTKPSGFGTWADVRYDVLSRGRRSVAVDLKRSEGVEIVLRLVETADALIEGFRPGVTERLGLGPEVCLERNARLVYGRMTGWGQTGPLAHAAGHDVNYIALTGALHAIGHADRPPAIPLNLVGDFGGGSLYLVVGVLAGLLEASRSGRGQVIDAAMVDGAASLLAALYGAFAHGFWKDQRASNMLDGGTHFYNVYETKDGKHVSIGSIESQFYAELMRLCDLDGEDVPGQFDIAAWPEMKERLTDLFKTKTRDEWCALMEGTDVCFAPVLSLGEAAEHPHMKERGTFTEVEGVKQPGPAPRFSRTHSSINRPPVKAGTDSIAVLQQVGFSAEEIEALLASGVIAGAAD